MSIDFWPDIVIMYVGVGVYSWRRIWTEIYESCSYYGMGTFMFATIFGTLGAVVWPIAWPISKVNDSGVRSACETISLSNKTSWRERRSEKKKLAERERKAELKKIEIEVGITPLD